MSTNYEPPSARQILWEYGVPEDVIDGVLCRHASELAEKIRSSQLDDSGSGVRCCTTMIEFAADYIDPEKGGQ